MRQCFDQLFEIQSIRMTHIADQQNHATHKKRICSSLLTVNNESQKGNSQHSVGLPY